MNWIMTPHSEPSSIVVTSADRSGLLGELRERLQQRRGFSVATLNLDHVVKLQSDAEFRKAYAAHTHVTADGNPIVWLSRLAGRDVALIPGSEMIEPLVEMAAQDKVQIAFFGATQASLEAASEALKARYKTVEVALCLAPPMGFDPDGAAAEDAIERIRASGAGLVFLALGAPKQERFAARAQAALPDMGFLSIGAGLDFISGAQQRAPRWVRAIAAEWLWRLLGNPLRLARRYGACIAILPRLTLQSLSARNSKVSR